MFKKIGVVTALAGTFLLSSAFQYPTHAEKYDHHQYKTYHYRSTNVHLWYNHSNSDYHHYHWNGSENGFGKSQSGSNSSGSTIGQGQSNSGQTNTGTGQTSASSGQTNTGTGQTSAGSGQKGTYQLSQFEQQVVQLTNKQRTSRGLQALKVNLTLSKMARAKSQDMATHHYFSHQSPTYGSPFNMMKQYGISYSSAGENIAEGQTTPQEVVNAWMNSPEHRANILNSSYTQIGVGYVANGNIWTQDFIG